MSTRLTLTQFGIAYATALVVMGALDGAWLGWLARDFYKREMGELMAESVRLVPAALFYLLYPLGLVYLGLMQPPESWGGAALRCAIVGLVAYGTYDLTALAVLRGWSVPLSVVDMAWGTFASSVAGTVAWRVAAGNA